MRENEVADIILGQDASGDKFKMRWKGIVFKLKIKPVSTRNLIKISREVANVKEAIPKSEILLPEQLANAESLKYICNSIAIATNTKFPKIISRALSELPIKDISFLWKLVIKQCDPSSFFFIIISTKGINKLTPEKGRSKEAKLSSAKLP